MRGRGGRLEVLVREWGFGDNAIVQGFVWGMEVFHVYDGSSDFNESCVENRPQISLCDVCFVTV